MCCVVVAAVGDVIRVGVVDAVATDCGLMVVAVVIAVVVFDVVVDGVVVVVVVVVFVLVGVRKSLAGLVDLIGLPVVGRQRPSLAARLVGVRMVTLRARMLWTMFTAT